MSKSRNKVRFETIAREKYNNFIYDQLISIVIYLTNEFKIMRDASYKKYLNRQEIYLIKERTNYSKKENNDTFLKSIPIQLSQLI